MSGEKPAPEGENPEIRQALAEAALDAAHHSLVHAGLCLELYARLEPTAGAGHLRRQLNRAIRLLIAPPPAATPVDLEADLDRLVATPGWEHPASALDRPRPDLGELLAACRSRLATAEDAGDRRRLAEVEARLERAHRIEQNARRRRWRRAFAAFVGIAPPADEETS